MGEDGDLHRHPVPRLLPQLLEQGGVEDCLAATLATLATLAAALGVLGLGLGLLGEGELEVGGALDPHAAAGVEGLEGRVEGGGEEGRAAGGGAGGGRGRAGGQGPRPGAPLEGRPAPRHLLQVLLGSGGEGRCWEVGRCWEEVVRRWEEVVDESVR